MLEEDKDEVKRCVCVLEMEMNVRGEGGQE